MHGDDTNIANIPDWLKSLEHCLLRPEHVISVGSDHCCIVNDGKFENFDLVCIIAKSRIYIFCRSDNNLNQNGMTYHYSRSFLTSSGDVDELRFCCNSESFALGYIEGIDTNRIVGWAASIGVSEPLQVGLRVNGLIKEIRMTDVRRVDIVDLVATETLHGFSFSTNLLGHPFDVVDVEIIGLRRTLKWVRNAFDRSIWPEKRRANLKQRNYSGLEFELERIRTQINQGSSRSPYNKAVFRISCNIKVCELTDIGSIFPMHLPSRNLAWFSDINLDSTPASDRLSQNAVSSFIEKMDLMCRAESCKFTCKASGLNHSEDQVEFSIGENIAYVKFKSNVYTINTYHPLSIQYAISAFYLAQSSNDMSVDHEDVVIELEKRTKYQILEICDNQSLSDNFGFKHYLAQGVAPILLIIEDLSFTLLYQAERVRYISTCQQSELLNVISILFQELSLSIDKELIIICDNPLLRSSLGLEKAMTRLGDFLFAYSSTTCDDKYQNRSEQEMNSQDETFYVDIIQSRIDHIANFLHRKV